MSMVATADEGSGAKEGGSSPLLLSPRTLRRPVAASLLLHISVCASLIFWWQSGVPAPQSVEEGLSVTFVELSPLAPAAPMKAAPVATTKPLSLPEPMPDPEPVVERIKNAVPLPEPVVQRPKPKPEQEATPQPHVSEASAITAQSETQIFSASHQPNNKGAGTGRASADDVANDEILVSTPRFRVTPRPPVYPNRARDLGQEGVAMVRVKLDDEGNAAEVIILESSGYALLDHAAIRAARGWQFEPERRDGRPVIAWVHIPVHFALR
ncbi:TonB family protein [Parvibaculum sp.]|uniref:energy transducer TonB n=1 Tax=Parvibaculum sp. TaxID=2024848 RepID=UPI003C724458